ncbi:MAG: NAD-dependent epimerase/dehydratase family protein [Planctomycetota bacterium]|jgi:nucleoside-diphosphate-sugar epimerase
MSISTPSTSAELDQLISTPDEGVIETARQVPGDFAVLGAGGKMGFHLCLMLQRALQAAGRTERVRAVSRFGSVRSRDEFEAIGCEVLAADLSDVEQLQKLPDTQNVFFLAGVKFGTAHDPELLQKMNVTMPKLVAERFQNSNIVALSTGCVYSFVEPQSGGSTEDDPTDPPGNYANSCKGREQAFVDAAAEWGTKSALIRLNYSIDLRYGVLVDIAQKVLAGEPVDVTTGYVNMIWQGDALAHTVRSLRHVAAPPLVLNVTGPGVLRVRDLAVAFGERFGRDVQFTGEEALLAWLNNAAKAHDLFGLPSVDFDQMIDWTAQWLQQGGELLGKPTHFENREGKF